MTNRLLYVDAVRGLFIACVVWIHAMSAIVFSNNPQAVSEVNPLVLLALAPLGILATWAPIFALLSGTANAYTLFAQMRRAEPAQRPATLTASVRGMFANSALLYLLSVMNMLFFHHAMEFNGQFRYTLVTSTLHDGWVHPYSAQLLFYNDTLALIALSGVAVSVTLYLLWRNDGFEKVRRNFLVLGTVLAAWLVASPFLHQTLDPQFYGALNEGHYLQALGLKLLIGANQSPFPNVAFAFMGGMLGIALAGQADGRLMRRYGYGFSAVFLAMAAIGIYRQGFAVIELTSHTFPMKLHLLNMGLMLALCTFLITKVEYGSPEFRAAFARRTTILRRFGMVGLSVFLLEGPVSVVFGKAYAMLWGGGAFPRNPVAVVLFLAFLLTIWNAVLRRWERHNFQYGFEWVLVKVVGKVRGRTSERLQANGILYKPAQPLPVLHP
jgi:hypothetical protein